MQNILLCKGLIAKKNPQKCFRLQYIPYLLKITKNPLFKTFCAKNPSAVNIRQIAVKNSKKNAKIKRNSSSQKTLKPKNHFSALPRCYQVHYEIHILLKSFSYSCFKVVHYFSRVFMFLCYFLVSWSYPNSICFIFFVYYMHIQAVLWSRFEFSLPDAFFFNQIGRVISQMKTILGIFCY